MKMMTMICAAAMAVCGLASAQSLPDNISVHFDVPVMVGETTFPAGDCNIQVLRGSDNVILKFSSTSTSAGATLVQVNRLIDTDSPANGSATITLTRRSNTYQFDKLIFPDHTGFQVIN
jgi:hypothetical protein